jgi:hypothetical protein
LFIFLGLDGALVCAFVTADADVRADVRVFVTAAAAVPVRASATVNVKVTDLNPRGEVTC